MSTMAITISVSLIISVCVTFMFVRKYKDQFSFHMGKDDKWSFKDWAGPLTATAAALSLIIAVIRGTTTITGLNLICGATIIACWRS